MYLGKEYTEVIFGSYLEILYKISSTELDMTRLDCVQSSSTVLLIYVLHGESHWVNL